MSAMHDLEAWGLAADGSRHICATKRCASVATALEWALGWTRTWAAPVNLYRVPYASTGSAPWADDQMLFICQLKARSGG